MMSATLNPIRSKAPRLSHHRSRPARREMIEGLESRTLFSAAPIDFPIHVPGPVNGIIHSAGHSQGNGLQGVLHNAAPMSINIQNIALQNGQLVASGLIGNNPFTAPVTLSLPAATTGVRTATNILNLQLGPIHLNVLGLHVDTSPICVGITAQSGPGNLLGNLLTSIANLLNGGGTIGGILGGLSGTQLTGLLNGLTGLLNGVLGQLTAATPTTVASTDPMSCNILHLSLGPVSLNLLGLNVNVDNCMGGPVVADVTAVPGSGNLLGNLLCDLSNALNTPPTGAVTGLLDRVLGDILGAL